MKLMNLNHSNSSLQSLLLKQLLYGDDQNDLTEEQQTALFEIPYKPRDPCVLIILRLDDGFRSYESLQDSLLMFSVMNIMEETFQHHFYVWSTKDEEDNIILLVKDRDDVIGHPFETLEKILETTIEKLQNGIKVFLKGHVTIVKSDWLLYPTQLQDSYVKTISKLNERAGVQRMILEPAKVKEVQRTSALHSLYEHPYVFQLLEAGEWGLLELKLNRVFKELSEYHD